MLLQEVGETEMFTWPLVNLVTHLCNVLKKKGGCMLSLYYVMWWWRFITPSSLVAIVDNVFCSVNYGLCFYLLLCSCLCWHN